MRCGRVPGLTTSDDLVEDAGDVDVDDIGGGGGAGGDIRKSSAAIFEMPRKSPEHEAQIFEIERLPLLEDGLVQDLSTEQLRHKTWKMPL